VSRFGARREAGAREVMGEALRDSSFYTLLAANTIALAVTLASAGSMPLMLAAFWAQSVIIGCPSLFRILALKNFSTEALGDDDQSPVSAEEKVVGVVLFLLIYGMLNYQFFLLVQDLGRRRGVDPFAGWEFWLCAAVFAAHHVYSLWRNWRSDAEARCGLQMLLFVPFVRVVPMLLACAVALVFSSGVLQQVVTAALKTWIDLAMHSIEHHAMRR
jgi:hypothetical protein